MDLLNGSRFFGYLVKAWRPLQRRSAKSPSDSVESVQMVKRDDSSQLNLFAVNLATSIEVCPNPARKPPSRQHTNVHSLEAPPTQAPTYPARALKVVRIKEPGHGSKHAGRLMISGRMADVCAELDRMASAHPGLLH
jgi:hypothetical protein